MTKPPVPTEPTTSHTCVDGKIRPGKGAFGRGADKCHKCWSKYRAEYNERKRNERYAKPGLSQVKLRRGNGGTVIKHGFYRMKLDENEAKLAEMLHRMYREEYPSLDNLADDMQLQMGLTNYVKSLRKEPNRPGDHNVRDYHAAYERGFKEAMEALALSRKHRKEGGTTDEARDMLMAFFTKAPGPQAGTEDGAEQTKAPPTAEGGKESSRTGADDAT
jgi:hypothetical protein